VSGINAGDLDREITLITGVKTQDSGTGEEVITWDADALDARVVWAEWLPAGSREIWLAQGRQESYADGAWKIYGISPAPTAAGTRILSDDGKYWDVKPPIEIGRGEGWLVPVVARADGNG